MAWRLLNAAAMGLFDKLKKTAQNAIKGTEPTPTPTPTAPPPEVETPPPPAVTGPSFRYDGDDLPLPPGWDGLSVEDWFFKLETLRDRLMHADEEALAPMTDADGEPLDPEETILILEGFTSGGHYEKFRTWGVGTWARKLGTDPTNLEFKMSGIAREKIIAAKAGAMSGAGGALEPVEGVTVETWAKLNAALAGGGGGNFDAMLAQAGMDRPKWDRVSAEWMARMQTDTTFAIATVYGAAFTGVTASVADDLSNEPMPFEKYCEIEAAMGCASDRGEDVTQTLSTFGIDIVKWSQLGAFWSKKMQQDAMGYHRLYTEYSAKYKAQYSSHR
jgi:hypothetical protein